jgi:hypothetical protein
MRFKQWLISEAASKIQWDPSITLPALGIEPTTPRLLMSQGSHADIYEHPTDSTKLIKITNDRRDAKNIITAQSLNSPNVVKCYAQTSEGVARGVALVVDYIKGETAPYSTQEFLGMLEGKFGADDRGQAYLRIMRPDPFRQKILQSHGLLNGPEVQKLSQLFKTLYLLERKLKIFLADFVDNIIDAGNAYVVVDLGQ